MAFSVAAAAGRLHAPLPGGSPSMPSMPLSPTGHFPEAASPASDTQGRRSSTAAESSAMGDAAVAGAPENHATRIIKRRAPVACRRCRRMRSKCVHSGAKPPCEGCRLAGVSLDECVFPVRGAPDLDRDYRHPRMKGDKARREVPRAHRSQPSGSSIGAGDSSNGRPSPAGPGRCAQMTPVSSLPADAWDLLPPLELIIDAVHMFTRQYFQLGFIPQRSFLEQLRLQPRSVSVFLLLSILSVSARLTPRLVEKHGDAVATAELYMEHASAIALTELYQEPTLARCQAFYLLSLAEQGSGYRNRSSVNMSIALRMAILMQLHREETYKLENATPHMVQKAESARRTLWMLYSQDNLHAGPSAPVSLAAGDITTLLPTNEDDFHNGVVPKTRAALEDTPPARLQPALVSMPTRPLFATLVQSHQLWGAVLRRAVRNDRTAFPWDSASDYDTIKQRLSNWESSLPQEHHWSPAQLRKFKARHIDLAYIAVTMVIRLCNIVIRKEYIPHMLRDSGPKAERAFWKTMSGELFSNVKQLFTQIDCWDQEREPGDGTGAQLAVFCVYSCSFMAAYLCKFPNSIAREGKHMLERTKDILSQSVNVWPLAARWLESVEKLSAADQKGSGMVPSSHEGGMAEGKDPIPSALHPPIAYSGPPGPSNTPFDDRRQLARQLGPGSPHAWPASPGASGSMRRHSNAGAGVNGTTSANQAPRQPPQLRTNDSLLNSSMLLPPPQPSPNLVTSAAAAAAHHATAAPTSTGPGLVPPPPLVLPPASSHAVPAGSGMPTPTVMSQNPGQPQIMHQHPQQTPPQHGIVTSTPGAGGLGGRVLSPGMANSLAAASASISPPPQHVPGQLHPDNRMDMMVPGFDAQAANATDEAEAAAVLVSGMLPHGVLPFNAGGGHPQAHHDPQQQYANPYTAHHLAGHMGGLGGPLSLAQLQSGAYYDQNFSLADDGYNSELQVLIEGAHAQINTPWTMFDI